MHVQAWWQGFSLPTSSTQVPAQVGSDVSYVTWTYRTAEHITPTLSFPSRHSRHPHASTCTRNIRSSTIYLFLPPPSCFLWLIQLIKSGSETEPEEGGLRHDELIARRSGGGGTAASVPLSTAFQEEADATLGAVGCGSPMDQGVEYNE